MTGPVRWGVAGTGPVSQQIARDLALVSGAELVAVSSRTAVSAARFGDGFSVPHRFTDYSAMLDADIDAVYLGTPHVTHFALAAEALRRGRHVLCEKPLGLDAAEVRALAEIARSSGVFLMEAMWMAFTPLTALVRRIVDSGEIGEVRAVQAAFGAPFPRDGSSRWQPGGSSLLDQGIYPVTLAHLMLGEPLGVVASGVIDEQGIDLSTHFTLEYGDGRFAQGASSMVEFLAGTATVSGSTGWIGIDPGFWFASGLTVHGYGPEGPTARRCEVEREGHGYVPMLREVTRAIAAGLLEHPLRTLDDTAAVFDTLDGVRRAAAAS
ncbi:MULTISPECIES: Gfo/Idh/MocA family protein [unclassified Rathayibacter]|uniref:Gfo/Idh/MocA family protein n=1 Tax=unclassified Rathayibacter TaxID=2609250 RepID=UPI000CE87AA9|nr:MULTISPECIES: Gfo/Idh/MocA family oxidoreductase [unclassified Rathayibacter]PPI41700.1 oxidoreductase [Rathayibacter sp. RFBD1]PPI63201.1 oxidoreductase [Rathayibacter sp. TRS19]